MNKIIESSLQKSQSYSAYKALVLNLLKEGKSTGINQNGSFIKNDAIDKL